MFRPRILSLLTCYFCLTTVLASSQLRAEDRNCDQTFDPAAAKYRQLTDLPKTALTLAEKPDAGYVRLPNDDDWAFAINDGAKPSIVLNAEIFGRFVPHNISHLISIETTGILRDGRKQRLIVVGVNNNLFNDWSRYMSDDSRLIGLQKIGVFFPRRSSPLVVKALDYQTQKEQVWRFLSLTVLGSAFTLTSAISNIMLINADRPTHWGFTAVVAGCTLFTIGAGSSMIQKCSQAWKNTAWKEDFGLANRLRNYMFRPQDSDNDTHTELPRTAMLVLPSLLVERYLENFAAIKVDADLAE